MRVYNTITSQLFFYIIFIRLMCPSGILTKDNQMFLRPHVTNAYSSNVLIHIRFFFAIYKIFFYRLFSF